MSKYRMSACQLLTDFLSLFVNLKFFTIMIGKEKDEFVGRLAKATFIHISIHLCSYNI
jgi:hypothetical protein